MYIQSSKKKNNSLPEQTLKQSRLTELFLISKRARTCNIHYKKVTSYHLTLHHVTKDISISATPSSINPDIPHFTVLDSKQLTQIKTKRIEELTSCQHRFHMHAKKMIHTFWDLQIKTKTFDKRVRQWLQFMDLYNDDLKKFLKDNNDVYNRRPLDVQILKHSHLPDFFSIPSKRPKLLSSQNTNLHNSTKSVQSKFKSRIR